MALLVIVTWAERYANHPSLVRSGALNALRLAMQMPDERANAYGARSLACFTTVRARTTARLEPAAPSSTRITASHTSRAGRPSSYTCTHHSITHVPSRPPLQLHLYASQHHTHLWHMQHLPSATQHDRSREAAAWPFA
eukprot:4304693-Prymnesium_polylepis.1